MNLIDLQDKLKNFSEQQLIQEMQMPTGQLPQFLLLSEITRRKQMRDAFAQEQMKDGTTTVAQDMVAAAGMPTEFAGQMAGTMAPQTDMAMNSGAMPQQSAMPAPVQGMAGGGIVALQEGGRIGIPQIVVRDGRRFVVQPDGSLAPETPRSAVPTGEDQLFGEGSPLAPRSQPAPSPISPGVEPGGLFSSLRRTAGQREYADRLMSEGAISQAEYDALTRGTTGASDEVILRVARGEEAPVDFAARAPMAPPTPPDMDVVAPEDTAVADQDPAAVADAEALAAVTAPPDPRGPLGGPSGGGIAAVAQGAGAPSDFEQELMTMLAAREKRAEQDKWLALAQAGMQLMSSSQPTFGGALGEAGASGLGALRESQAGSEADRLGLLSAIEQSRMGREKMDLERQALAARRAAGGGGGAAQDPFAFGMTTDEVRQYEIFENMANSSNPSAQLMGQRGVEELVARVQARSNMGGASAPNITDVRD
jgi:hypothetical protein